MQGQQPAQPNGSIIGRATLDARDIEHAMAQNKGGRRIGRYVLVVLPLAFVGLVAIHLLVGSSVDWKALAPSGIVTLLIAGAFLYARKRTARRLLEGKLDLVRDLAFELDDSGWAIRAATGNSRSDWSALHHFEESESAFLFYLNPMVYQVVPKRAFDPSPHISPTSRALAQPLDSAALSLQSEIQPVFPSSPKALRNRSLARSSHEPVKYAG